MDDDTKGLEKEAESSPWAIKTFSTKQKINQHVLCTKYLIAIDMISSATW